MVSNDGGGGRNALEPCIKGRGEKNDTWSFMALMDGAPVFLFAVFTLLGVICPKHEVDVL